MLLQLSATYANSTVPCLNHSTHKKTAKCNVNLKSYSVHQQKVILLLKISQQLETRLQR